MKKIKYRLSIERQEDGSYTLTKRYFWFWERVIASGTYDYVQSLALIYI